MVLSGQRLDPPEKIPDHVAAIMTKCWSQAPADRPSFKDILLQLTNSHPGDHALDDDEGSKGIAWMLKSGSGDDTGGDDAFQSISRESSQHPYVELKPRNSSSTIAASRRVGIVCC